MVTIRKKHSFWLNTTFHHIRVFIFISQNTILHQIIILDELASNIIQILYRATHKILSTEVTQTQSHKAKDFQKKKEKQAGT